MVNGGKTEHFWKSPEPLSNNSQKEFIQLRVTQCSYINGLKSIPPMKWYLSNWLHLIYDPGPKEDYHWHLNLPSYQINNTEGYNFLSIRCGSSCRWIKQWRGWPNQECKGPHIANRFRPSWSSATLDIVSTRKMVQSFNCVLDDDTESLSDKEADHAFAFRKGSHLLYLSQHGWDQIWWMLRLSLSSAPKGRLSVIAGFGGLWRLLARPSGDGDSGARNY